MIWVVFGGQFGSEGKGALCAYLARGYGFAAAVRGGGPQAGHTFFHRGRRTVVRQVPVACVVDPHCLGYIGPGAVVNAEVLLREMQEHNLFGRVFVHPNAFLIHSYHRDQERIHSLDAEIGSTLEGVGAARAARAMRGPHPVGLFPSGPLAEVIDGDLRTYDQILSMAYSHRVMAEGAQGFGLSLWHGPYPYVTSADTTPAAILSECGLPVAAVERSIVVMRTFPIRVGGNSGPLDDIKWEDVPSQPGPETTTVTGRTRRIGNFSWEALERMLSVCGPSHAALMFCDYLDPRILEQPITECPDALEFWRRLNARVTTPWIGVGGPEFTVRGAMEGVTTMAEVKE